MSGQLEEISREKAKELRDIGFGHLVEKKTEVRFYVRTANGNAMVKKGATTGVKRPKAEFLNISRTQRKKYTEGSETNALVFEAVREAMRTPERVDFINKAKLRKSVMKTLGYKYSKVNKALRELVEQGYLKQTSATEQLSFGEGS